MEARITTKEQLIEYLVNAYWYEKDYEGIAKNDHIQSMSASQRNVFIKTINESKEHRTHVEWMLDQFEEGMVDYKSTSTNLPWNGTDIQAMKGKEVMRAFSENLSWVVDHYSTVRENVTDELLEELMPMERDVLEFKRGLDEIIREKNETISMLMDHFRGPSSRGFIRPGAVDYPPKWRNAFNN